jgi:transposase-like protein
MDETYIKVSGRWVYLYRAVDEVGRTVDFFLSRNRDVNAAKTFLRGAMKDRRIPTKITLDAYAASHRAVREMKVAGELPQRVMVRSNQYLNNLIEQDHRRVKQRIRPMLGFKRFDNAVVTISGIELAERSRRASSRRASLVVAEQPCRNCGVQRSPLDPNRGHSMRKNPANLAPDPSLHQSRCGGHSRALNPSQ